MLTLSKASFQCIFDKFIVCIDNIKSSKGSPFFFVAIATEPCQAVHGSILYRWVVAFM